MTPHTTDKHLAYWRLSCEGSFLKPGQAGETVVGKQFVLTADTLPWGHTPLLCSALLCFSLLFFAFLCFALCRFSLLCSAATLPWGQLSPGTNPYFSLSQAVCSSGQSREKKVRLKTICTGGENPTVCWWKHILCTVPNFASATFLTYTKSFNIYIRNSF